MSRVGKQPITVPNGVEVKISGGLVSIKGKNGTLEREVRPEVEVKLDEGKLWVTRKGEETQSRAFHGLERSLLNNMVLGVSQGFEKILDVIGVGYRVDVKGSTVELGLGYSHPINFALPENVKASLLKEGRDVALKLESPDKQLLGQTAARIRSLRPPEPYKGKGVKYRDEVIKRKAGKAGK